jgi:predicted dehydrogenase
VAHRAGRPYEDLVAVVGELTNGVVTNSLVNWLSPLKERRVVVTGERGCFEADTLTADLTFHANGRVATEWDAISSFRGVSEGDVVRYAIPKPEPLLVELGDFRNAVLGKANSVVTMQDGLATLAVAEAVLRSAAGEGAITLDGAQCE